MRGYDIDPLGFVHTSVSNDCTVPIIMLILLFRMICKIKFFIFVQTNELCIFFQNCKTKIVSYCVAIVHCIMFGSFRGKS